MVNLTSTTKVNVVVGEDTVPFVFNTPWGDKDFNRRHRDFLKSRFAVKGRKMNFENNADECRIEFGKEQLVSVGIELDGKPIEQVGNWKEAVPANLLIAAVMAVFEEANAEQDASKKS